MVHNEIYSTEAGGWWDENHFLHLLKSGLNPARFDYFHSVIQQLPLNPKSLRVLDIGCGGGVLSEEFARLGCAVTGIDAAGESLRVARLHAARAGLEIQYCRSQGESLPLEGGSFDAALCCDVLEHVDDYRALLAEAGRVLKPGGVLFFDTINRTERSRLENILIAQEFPFTRFFPRDTHLWEKFIRPEELLAALEQVGLKSRGMAGLRPGIPDWQVGLLLVARKLGWLSFAGLGKRLKFAAGADLGASYMGWAVRK